MTHTYHITGMTCSGCQAKVQGLLSKVAHVTSVVIDLPNGEASINMDKHVPTQVLQAALKDHPKYQLTESGNHSMMQEHTQSKSSPAHDHGGSTATADDSSTDAQSWIVTYKPILLIFSFITGITLLAQAWQGHFHWMNWMNYFMAGFFLVFSFFKLLNLKGFAESYSTYDIVAKRWMAWGYIYAFVELGLGIAYLLHFNPPLINGITFVVMSVSIVGVLQSVLNKRKIRCACLGDVFNLPMSTVTIIEDALMIAMSGIMLVTML